MTDGPKCRECGLDIVPLPEVCDSCRTAVDGPSLSARLEVAEQQLGNLLAIIHRDGGHHTEKVGARQSVEDAHQRWADLILRVDAASEAYKEVCQALVGYEGEIFGAGAMALQIQVLKRERDNAVTRVSELETCVQAFIANGEAPRTSALDDQLFGLAKTACEVLSTESEGSRVFLNIFSDDEWSDIILCVRSEGNTDSGSENEDHWYELADRMEECRPVSLVFIQRLPYGVRPVKTATQQAPDKVTPLLEAAKQVVDPQGAKNMDKLRKDNLRKAVKAMEKS